MNFKMIQAAAVAASLAVASFAGAAHAATNGTLGATSTGSVDINAVIPNLAQISGLDDINLGTWSGADLSGSDQFCVFSSTRSYTITATSGNGTGATFRLKDAGTNFIAYTVSWTDSAPATTALTSGTASGAQATSATSVNCGGADNTTVSVNVPSANIASVPAGNYSDTLTLLVTPQ